MRLDLVLFAPIIAKLNEILAKLDKLAKNDEKIIKNQGAGMGAVQVLQEDLDAYAGEVSSVADELSDDIKALTDAVAAGQPLPQANVDSLKASLDKLKSLDVPDTEPVEPTDPDSLPHPDQTLPGDLPPQ